MDETSSDSSFEDATSAGLGWEPIPSRIAFEFVKMGKSSLHNVTKNIQIFTGRSKLEGTLFTHGIFKWNKNSFNRKGNIHWYICADQKTTGCTARATIHRNEFVDGETGETRLTNELVQVSTPEVPIYVM